MKKILFIMGALLLSACASKKNIVSDDYKKVESQVDSTETVVVKNDTDARSHDSSVKETEKIQTDTKVEKSDSTVMTVDLNGNIIKQETWHKEKETVSRNREYEKQLRDSVEHLKVTCDSLRQYVSKCDSLQEKLSHKEYTTVEKIKIPKWSWFCLGFSILVIIFAIVKIVRWLQ